VIPGIDVSHWQGEIDWARVARSGVKFAFIKATEFPDRRITVYIDQNLRNNINGAVQNNVLWGAYHFFRTHIDPLIQAQVFCETVGEFNSLPPVMDLEVAGSKGTKLNEKVNAFVHEVERISGRRPIIYTSGGFWRSYMLYNRRADADWAQAYPLWLAQYTTTWPSIPYPWVSWNFWQYSDGGRLPGIPGGVDLNWYIGSYQELVNEFVTGIPSSAKPASHGLLNDKGESTQSPINEKLPQGNDDKKADAPSPSDESDDDWIKRYFFNQ
jgi:lysozyme